MMKLIVLEELIDANQINTFQLDNGNIEVISEDVSESKLMQKK